MYKRFIKRFIDLMASQHPAGSVESGFYHSDDNFVGCTGQRLLFPG